jgi:hypothetical protein
VRCGRRVYTGSCQSSITSESCVTTPIPADRGQQLRVVVATLQPAPYTFTATSSCHACTVWPPREPPV